MQVIDRFDASAFNRALASMFKARKQIFVDLLGWDVPVIDGRYEIDEFDTEHATYLVLSDPDGEHLASARLLPTDRPHLLDTHFAHLCESEAPAGPDVLEITRFCLSRNQSAADRMISRKRLVSALVDHALSRGITTYVGVAEMGWLQQILAFGWRCRPLGLPVMDGGKMLGALSIDIDAETPSLLMASGTYVGDQVVLADPMLA
ncbi:autoinducer synthase [Sphingomonas sp. ID1715]|uniref:acyl-homoserine-lactone synthase n=1 Tax=Sphingomonas sp. ID1715 TaxID=1656898 RepID=UPI00148937BD|nr:acyl-homoserine-lactone synthase [Sphingomonas sp. ID1715]NNM77981.1 autoinducer synthase [Sphingomonas sp. ID1715]